jgi:hypothetical protein
MLQANHAKVEWDSKKKRWEVTIEVGTESIKRWNAANRREAGDAALQAMAIETARDEGYELEAQRVSIVR